MTALSQRGEQIVDEAIELLSSGGVPALTTKNLAKAVGVTEPALYRHFKNKMDILAAILNRQEKNMPRLFKRMAEHYDSPLDQIQNVYARIFHNFSQTPAMAAVVFTEEIFRQESTLSEQMNRIITTVEEKIMALLKSEQGRRECRTDVPPQDLARMIIGSSRLLVTRWRLDNHSFDLEKEGALLWKSLRIVLAPNPSTPTKEPS